MRVRALALTLAGILFLNGQPPPVQACEDQLLQNMTQMAENAIQCGESAELMNSIQSLEKDQMMEACTGVGPVDSQLQAFNECSRVYVCAVMAYDYALSHLSEYSGDCSAAAAAGLQRYPIQ